LECVLGDVELLLSAIDADSVVLTADHGNSFGEAGVFGHYRHVPIPSLRTVPWVETTARRTRDYEPAEYDTEPSDGEVSERLSALGYIED